MTNIIRKRMLLEILTVVIGIVVALIGSLTVESREKTSQALNNLYFLCQNFSFIIL